MFRTIRRSRGSVSGLRARSSSVCHRPHLEMLETRELPSATSAVPAQLRDAYGQIPLSFEANQGQTDSRVQFLAHGQGYGLFLTGTEAVLSLEKTGGVSNGEGTVLRIQLVGGDATAAVAGRDRLAATSNYFRGTDVRQWQANIPTYGRVVYQNVYAGVDLVYYGNQRQLEYDFVVAPGADPNRIALNFQGADGLSLDGQGNLVVQTGGGDLVEHAPVIYQESAAGKQYISGQYVLEGGQQVGFRVGAYDPARPLVIDPTLVYSTFLGGNADDLGNGIVVDASGNAYITGSTFSSNFPTTSGAFQRTPQGGSDAFVTKLNSTGTGLVYSTYLGGTGTDVANGIAVDSSGNAYVTGYTTSTNFPTTSGAFQTTLRGFQNAFVTKLNPSGSALVYSTLLGGSNLDEGLALGVDGAGNAFVTGDTLSSDFPTTTGAFQTLLGSISGNAFVTKINPSGTGLVYSTFLGGNTQDRGLGLAVDSAGNAFVAGSTMSSNFPTTSGAYQTSLRGTQNAFVTEVNPSGAGLVYSTYLGGTSQDSANGVAVDAAGNAYVAGQTTSANFPTTPGAYQVGKRGPSNAFVTKVNPSGASLVYSTFLGGTGSDQGLGITVDAAGNAYVAGAASSADFPTTPGAVQTSKTGNTNAFVTKLNAAGSGLAYSTYLGGINFDQVNGIAVDASGAIYVVGTTSSIDFPTTAGAFQTIQGGGFDTFVAKLDASPQLTHFSITPSDPSVTAGVPFSLLVKALDANNNVVPGYRGIVHFVSTDTASTLPTNYTFAAGDNGMHTFTNVILRTAGNQSVQVMDTSNSTINGSAAITVIPAAASTMVVSGFPSPITAGIAGNVTVTVKDPFGNIATGYRGTVHFNSNDGQAMLPGNYPFVASDNGTRSFSVTLKTAGTRFLTATDIATGSITGSQTGIAVNAAAVSLFVVTGFPASTTAGVAGSFTVTAKDPFGNTVPTYFGRVVFSSTDSQAVLPADYVFIADDNGAHRFNATLKTAGTQSLTATDANTSSIIGTQSGIAVTPADASVFLVTGFPTPVVAGSSHMFLATVKDAFNNTVPSYRGAVRFRSSDDQADVPMNYTFTVNDAGAHTFSAALKTAGTQSLTVLDTDTGVINGTQSGIVVTPAAISRFLVAGFPTSTIAGAVNVFGVEAIDPYANVIPTYLGTIRITSTDNQAELPLNYTYTAADAGLHFFGAVLKTAATQSLTATDTVTGSLTGAQTGIVVTPAAVSTLAVTGFPSPVNAGVQANFTVTAKDPYGNTVPSYVGSVRFSSGDIQASLPGPYTFLTTDNGVHSFSATLKTAGSQSLTATDTVTGTITGAQTGIAVNPGVVTTLVVMGFPTPATAGDVNTVVVVAQDLYGNAATSYRGTVHFSSTDNQAELPRDFTFRAADNGVHTFGAVLKTAAVQTITATDTVTGTLTGSQTGIAVVALAADHFQVNAPATVVTGQAFAFTVTAKDPYGNTDLTYTGTVAFSSTDPDPGVMLVPNYTFLASDQGVRTFPGGATLITLGNQMLTATDIVSGITGSASIMVVSGDAPIGGGGRPGGAWRPIGAVEQSSLNLSPAVPPSALGGHRGDQDGFWVVIAEESRTLAPGWRGLGASSLDDAWANLVRGLTVDDFTKSVVFS